MTNHEYHDARNLTLTALDDNDRMAIAASIWNIPDATTRKEAMKAYESSLHKQFAEIEHKRISDTHGKLVCTRRSKDSSDER